MSVTKIIRALSGVLLCLQCVVLIVFFGIIPMLGLEACPVTVSSADSVYSKGSLAFVREVSPGDLKKGDVAVYCKGGKAVGSRVEANDREASSVILESKNGGVAMPYRKINGRGSGFSVPVLGGYADWLIHGNGLLVSVIVIGATFCVFGVSAFMVKYDE